VPALAVALVSMERTSAGAVQPAAAGAPPHCQFRVDHCTPAGAWMAAFANAKVRKGST